MKNEDIVDEGYLSNNWLTSEVLIGMYSRVFNNILLTYYLIFKKHDK